MLAERAGFHSIQVPDRHGRTECYFPGPEQILTILARETDRVAIGSFTWLATLFHPMKGAEQFSVIDNLSQGRLYTTVSRGFHPGYWMQFGIPQEKLLGRFLEAVEDLARGVQGRALRLRGQVLAGGGRPAGAAALPGGRLADLGRRQRHAGGDPALGRPTASAGPATPSR